MMRYHNLTTPVVYSLPMVADTDTEVAEVDADADPDAPGSAGSDAHRTRRRETVLRYAPGIYHGVKRVASEYGMSRNSAINLLIAEALAAREARARREARLRDRHTVSS